MFSFTDVTLLVGRNETGLACVRRLESRGVRCAHTFGTDSRQSRDLKFGFFMGDGRVKATTIHSFKGWESRALVLHIPHAQNDAAVRAAYTGLTRIKSHAEGSFLTVVCAAPELESFGRTLPGFQNLRDRYP